MDITWQDTIDIENREIFLFGDEDNEINHKSSLLFLKSLRLLENNNNKPILIHQNNLGGCVNNGLLIYDAIFRSPCYITIVLHGNAISMGSIIPQAADKRIMMPNAVMMIHGSSLNLSASMKASKTYMDFHKTETKNMLQILVSRAMYGEYFKDGWTENRISKFILGKLDKLEDWYLNPEAAQMYGFIDDIIGNTYASIQEYKATL